jgi:phage baseplate assembly protein W
MTEEINGFSSPFRIDSNSGGLVQQAGLEKLKENIIHILLTGAGERVMRREYGGGISQLVHDPNSEALRAIVQHQIVKSIGRWEPRVALKQVQVQIKGATLIVDLDYVVRQTRQPQSLSVPIGLGGI